MALRRPSDPSGSSSPSPAFPDNCRNGVQDTQTHMANGLPERFLYYCPPRHFWQEGFPDAQTAIRQARAPNTLAYLTVRLKDNPNDAPIFKVRPCGKRFFT